MSQLHLYLPDKLSEEVRRRASQEGISVSKYLAGVVRREVESSWPEGFFDEVYGAWLGSLERPPQGSYETRASFEPSVVMDRLE